jgi:uncharacterized membrane protein YhfC
MGLYITFPLTILIEIVFPILLGYWVIRRYHTSWRLVGIGALIYLSSQVVHIPLLDGINWLYVNDYLQIPSGMQLILLNAVIGGLAAGICEETARLIGFKILKAPVQNEGGAFSLGVGHAGVESIIVAGLPMLGTFISMLAYKNVDPATTTLDADSLAQITSLWSMEWYVPLASAVERLVAIIVQISLTFIVLQVFIRKSYWYFGAAILWHAVVDGVILAVSILVSSAAIVLAVEVVFALVSGWILWYLITHKKPENTPAILDVAIQ